MSGGILLLSFLPRRNKRPTGRGTRAGPSGERGRAGGEGEEGGGGTRVTFRARVHVSHNFGVLIRRGTVLSITQSIEWLSRAFDRSDFQYPPSPPLSLSLSLSRSLSLFLSASLARQTSWTREVERSKWKAGGGMLTVIKATEVNWTLYRARAKRTRLVTEALARRENLARNSRGSPFR